MIQAAATGALDFSKADTFDRKWHIKRDLILSYVARTNLQEIYKSKLSQHFAVLTYDTEQQVFDHHWEQVNKLQNSMLEVVLPWLKTSPTDINEVATQLTQDYTNVFGDPNSEEFQAEADRLIEYWQSTRRKDVS